MRLDDYFVDDIQLHRGSGLVPAGGGVRLAGQGWKTGVGATLVSLGGIGAASNLGSDKALEGVIGGSILAGLGGLLIHLDKKKKAGGSMKTMFDRELKNALVQLLRARQVGGRIDDKQLKDMLKKYSNIQIHARDIFGPNWKVKGQELLRAIESQSGGNIGKSLRKISEKAKDKLRQFVEGKTKFKPSDLLNYASGAVGLAGTASAFIPGVDLISVPAASAAALGLKSAAQILKTSGRGMCGKGSDILYQTGDAAIIAGILGISVLAAKKLLDTYRKKKGSGLKLAGQGLPPKLKEWIAKHPAESKRVAEFAISGETVGSGKVEKLAKILGIAVTAAQGAYKLYAFLKEHPELVERVISLIGSMRGSGDLPPGVCYTKSGKIKRDRYSVYYGYHQKTASGLTKDDFIKKGNKIISKRKSELGKKALKNLK